MFVMILRGIAGSWVGGLPTPILGLKIVAGELIAAVLGAMLLLVRHRLV